MLKRAHKGTFHKMSPKHLDRYVQEFAARHNLRDEDTIDIMAAVITGMNGKRLRYVDLIADNGLDFGSTNGLDVHLDDGNCVRGLGTEPVGQARKMRSFRHSPLARYQSRNATGREWKTKSACVAWRLKRGIS